MASPTQHTTPADVVGAPVIARLREAGFAVVPFDCPDYAVGEVMTWTGCDCPNRGWEALNDAINLMVRPDLARPEYLETMAKIGSGELPREAYFKGMKTDG